MNNNVWEPRTVTTDEYVDPNPVRALCSVLDSGAAPIGPGDPLPPLWHWAALARWPASSSIGPDGHPSPGSFMPPVGLPRRMFAGGEVRFYSTVLVGSTVRRVARVVSVTPKSGRSGKLVIVVVEISLYTESGTTPAVVERQNLIYREAGDVARAEVAPKPTELVGVPLRREREWNWELRTDPTVLMRFSAATANPHRIHYDRPYATDVEGYPNLVVHGPLMTLALAETIRLERPDAVPSVLRHRNLVPLFCGTPAHIRRRADPECELSVSVVTSAAEHTILTAELLVPEGPDQA